MNDGDLAHVFTFGVLLGDFFDMIAQKSGILPVLILTVYKLVAKRPAHTTTKTQLTQHTQPKWASATLPLSGFGPLPPWVEQRRH